jgi:hypothetical protein
MDNPRANALTASAHRMSPEAGTCRAAATNHAARPQRSRVRGPRPPRCVTALLRRIRHPSAAGAAWRRCSTRSGSQVATQPDIMPYRPTGPRTATGSLARADEVFGRDRANGHRELSPTASRPPSPSAARLPACSLIVSHMGDEQWVRRPGFKVEWSRRSSAGLKNGLCAIDAVPHRTPRFLDATHASRDLNCHHRWMNTPPATDR